MENLLKQMGTRIHDRRKQLRLTQEELAEKAGLTPQTVSTAELGKKALRPENIIRICSALEISTDYLLLGTVTNEDYILMSEKLSQLSPQEYRYLEEIVNSYVGVLKNKEKES
ncbi:MAG: helix-turn-helix domain-containing protein [Lachnospiraceae bacterium]|nr:helix-turn-helix domain-containing protein [Lachnospiraceae bacterium]